jgi:drug/metabolite transporter (DMT)-like permease
MSLVWSCSMQYLIITIILNVIISVIFKFLPRFGVDTLQAVVVNYCVCVITGCLFIGNIPFNGAALHASWLPWALLMGCIYIGIFYLLGYSTKVDGITTTTIANKLSLVIPVVFSFIVYHEHAGMAKVIGVALALPAIYLTAHVKGDDNKPQNMLYPILIFLGGGVLDTMTNYVQRSYLDVPATQAVFAVFCFAVAAMVGLLLSVSLVAMGRMVVQMKNIVAGLCIGIPNYFSIYYFIRTLNCNWLHSSATIPVLNIGILGASSLTAIGLFREHVNILRIIGLALSVAAILLIALGDI